MATDVESSGAKPCSVSIRCEDVTKTKVEYLVVEIPGKTVHAIKTTKDDYPPKIFISSVEHHVWPGGKSMSDDERDTVASAALAWKSDT